MNSNETRRISLRWTALSREASACLLHLSLKLRDHVLFELVVVYCTIWQHLQWEQWCIPNTAVDVPFVLRAVSLYGHWGNVSDSGNVVVGWSGVLSPSRSSGAPQRKCKHCTVCCQRVQLKQYKWYNETYQMCVSVCLCVKEGERVRWAAWLC